MRCFLPGWLMLLTCVQSLTAGDWPAQRADSARSGQVPEAIPNALSLRWSLRFSAPPKPAWPTSQRMDDDLVFEPIVVGDLILVGSSAENVLLALDAANGRLRWRYCSEAPIRFAPVAWQDRVFLVGDDGQLRALALRDGSLLWSHLGAQGRAWVLGNERLTSRWPARGGPLVLDGVVYYTAGVWPSDGVSVHALDAASGRVLWSNKDSGGLDMAQPHGGAHAQSGVAPQGYLAARGPLLVVPTGRAVPAVFDRQTGQLSYYHLAKNQQRGGVRVAMSEQGFFNAGCYFEGRGGELKATLGSGAMVVLGDSVLRAEGRSLQLHRSSRVERRDRKGNPVEALEWSLNATVPLPAEALQLIVAGEDAIVGMENQVCAVDYRGQRTVWWSHAVEGRALGVAAANGRVVVSTDRGVLHVFDGEPPGAKPEVLYTRSRQAKPAPAQIQRAQELLRDAPKAGYALLLGDSSGDLAMALAQSSSLELVLKPANDAAAQVLRGRLADVGMLGTRVTVLGAATALSDLPKGFANVIWSLEPAAFENASMAADLRRLQRPYNGLLVVAKADGSLQRERASAPKGAGQWTHQNGNAANTLCSDDELVRGRLSMHWFRDVEFEIANRHGQGPAPLVANGVMVMGGVNGVCAVDAFNGRLMWQLELPGFLKDFDGIHHDVGIGDTGGPMCLGRDHLYVKVGPEALRVALEDGKVLSRWPTPVPATAADRNWGFIAQEGGLLFGSVENTQHRVSPRYQNSSLRTESLLFFALDATTGAVRWRYQPKGSIRHNAIAIAAGRVFLVDRPLVKEDLVLQARRNGVAAARISANALPPGELICLEAETGKRLWSQKEDVWGTQLAASSAHGVLLMNYKAVRHNFFELPSEAGGRLAAFDMTTGKRLWDQVAEYQTRPLINDRSIYAQGGAWDLLSGSPLNFELKRSYGCGQISGSRHLMLFRSATLGYVDLSGKQETQNYGGIRPGCWINSIPAEGLVLVPDGSSKCHCSYQMKAWFALQGEEPKP